MRHFQADNGQTYPEALMNASHQYQMKEVVVISIEDWNNLLVLMQDMTTGDLSLNGLNRFDEIVAKVNG
jgi:hypothetical protein